MTEKLKEIVNKLINTNKTISTMESCTGGELASLITNVTDSSKILKFSAVTYSNEFKIKMGVNRKTIEKYTVYSKEVAREMSKAITKFTNSYYGVGITGEITIKPDHKSYVYYAIYDSVNDKFWDGILEIHEDNKKENKFLVTDKIIEDLFQILN